jgi:hypothetical protein
MGNTDARVFSLGEQAFGLATAPLPGGHGLGCTVIAVLLGRLPSRAQPH